MSVVGTAKPIQVSHANRRSNRFWPLNGKLNVLPLSRTCRQLYSEAVPAFYAHNQLHFASMHELIVYLVAITPYRRTLIRSISVSAELYTTDIVRRTWAMLSCCTGLKDFIIMFSSLSDWPHLKPDEALTLQLHRLARVANIPADDRYQTTTRRVSFRLNWRGHTFEFPPGKDHSRKDIPQFMPSDSPAHQHSEAMIATAIAYENIRQQVKALYMALRQIEPRNPKDDLDEVHEVIASAGIDFPGEERVAQSRIKSEMWSISSRTRRKCESQVDPLGVLQPAAPPSKYTDDGILIEKFRYVVGVRWAEGPDAESQIECELVFGAMGTPTTWEPLRVIAYLRGISLLCQFYEKHTRRFPKDSRSVIRALGGAPTPQDVMQELMQSDEDVLQIPKIFERLENLRSDWTRYLDFHRKQAQKQKAREWLKSRPARVELEARRRRGDFEVYNMMADKKNGNDSKTHRRSSRNTEGTKAGK